LKLTYESVAKVVQDLSQKIAKLEEKSAVEFDRMQARVERCNRVVYVAIKLGDKFYFLEEVNSLKLK